MDFRCDAFARVYAVKIGILTALGFSEPLQPSPTSFMQSLLVPLSASPIDSF
jgi:hypothetical protein